MFFSRAFNTILPLLPRDMLVQTRVNHHLSAWILYYPTNRPQYVRVWGAHKNSSDSIPFLQIHLKLYNAANWHLQNCPRASSASWTEPGLGSVHWKWCQRNHLQINSGITFFNFYFILLIFLTVLILFFYSVSFTLCCCNPVHFLTAGQIKDYLILYRVAVMLLTGKKWGEHEYGKTWAWENQKTLFSQSKTINTTVKSLHFFFFLSRTVV